MGAWAVLIAALLTSTPAAAEPTVRMVYLVPQDRPVRVDYARAMREAAEHLQLWMHGAMPGSTFRLHTPVVEIIRTPHVEAWYASNPSGTFNLWYWNNALADGFALTGGGFNDPQNRWVFYLDAQPACNQAVGATSGVALLPRNDLRGLVDEPNIPPCAGQPPDTWGVCRWVGGLGHELGHALGLPHPAACEDGNPGTICPSDALMWAGYALYPSTYLLPSDIASLSQSPFFSPIEPAAAPFDCATLLQPGDVNGDWVVDVSDLLAVINAWGPCPPLPTPCDADHAPVQGDGTVNVNDLLMVINHWG